VGEKLLAEKISAIRATLDINSEEMLLETLQLLKNANRILLVGIGASGLVAKDFSWKLMKIGINAVAEQDMHALLASVQAMTAGDVLLAISYTGERREINLAAQEAAQTGADVLAFTGFTPNTLQQCATHCLYTVAEEQSTRSAAISSTSAQLALTDLLFMALVQNDPERASSHIRHSEALVRKLV
jgi:DNA-binding MurR/RpiR family transcriptional regulator